MKIYQPRNGYRFSTDTVVLADFVRVSPSESLLDLGTGVGVIPLLVWHRSQFRVAVGVELQMELSRLARRNIRLNQLTTRIHIIQKDLTHLDTSDFESIDGLYPNAKFDAISANPPYWPLGSGKLNPDSQKATARHELRLTFCQLVDVCSRFLKPGGRFYFVQLIERRNEILGSLEAHCFHVLQMKPLQLRSKQLVLFEAELFKPNNH